MSNLFRYLSCLSISKSFGAEKALRHKKVIDPINILDQRLRRVMFAMISVLLNGQFNPSTAGRKAACCPETRYSVSRSSGKRPCMCYGGLSEIVKVLKFHTE